MKTRTRKAELQTIARGISIDKPIDFHHRSGDTEDAGGNRLDLYASTESAEEVYFEEEDEKARRVFLKLFKKFLKTTYTKAEIKFLIMSASGAKPQEIRERLKITSLLKYREAIQEKGFKNAEALRAAVVCSGWSRAEEFAQTIFRRVEMYQCGEKIIEELPENKRARLIAERAKRYYEENREKLLECYKHYYEENREKILEHKKRYYEANLEQVLERSKRYYEENREQVLERVKRYCEENREKILKSNKYYYESHPEKMREKWKRYYEKNREKVLERVKRYDKAHPEKMREKLKRYRKAHPEKMRQYWAEHSRETNAKRKERRKNPENNDSLKWYKKNREQILERKKEYRKAHPEKIAEINKRYRERKKMEKLAAKLRAKENLPAIRIETAEAPQEIIIE